MLPAYNGVRASHVPRYKATYLNQIYTATWMRMTVTICHLMFDLVLDIIIRTWAES